MNLEDYRRQNEKRDAAKRARLESVNREPLKWWTTPSDRIALIGAISTVALALLALFQFYVFRGQLTAMENDQRPWVYATNPIVAVTPLTFNEQGGHLILSVTLKNAGRTPARFAKIDGNMFSRAAMMYDEIAWANCNKRKNLPVNSLYDGITVFPNDQITQRHYWKMQLKDIQDIKDKKAFTIMLTGCVDYIGNDQQHHQSRFVFELDRAGKPGESLVIDPQAGDVPPERLLLSVNPDVSGDAF
jgi:hypothetical protein